MHRDSGAASAMVAGADVSRLVGIDNALSSKRICMYVYRAK